MPDELQIGTHKLRITGNTVLTRWIGTPEYEDVLAVHQHLDQVLSEHGRAFVINDMRQSGLPSTKTRKWIAEWARRNPVVSVVNFGASLPIRILQTLIFRALTVVGNGPTIESVHCGSEAEAFAWIAARSRQIPSGSKTV